MPTKKRTSTKPLPAAPAISESALRFTSRFLLANKQLTGEQHHDDPLQLAFEYFIGWPNEFWLRHQEQAAVRPLDDHAFRQLLAQAHESATRVLMRAAESRGLDSSAIRTASRIAREAILSRTNFHLPPGGWSRPWPDCLGDHLRTLPDRQQQAIEDADALLTRLRMFQHVAAEPTAAPSKPRKKRRKPGELNGEMLNVIMERPESRGWTADKWAAELKACASQITKQNTWKKLEEFRELQKINRQKDRRRGRAAK
jgi:hypothetical protein